MGRLPLPDHTDSQATAGLTRRRRERGLSVGPRVRCPVCHADVALGTSAELREHRDARELTARSMSCPASGCTISEMLDRIAGRR